MITATSANKVFTNPRVMKQRFQEAAGRASEKQEFVDKLELMADGFLSLDQSDADQDKELGSIAVGDDTTIVMAQANPFGGAISFEYLKETESKTEEYTIQMGMTGMLYSENINGMQTEVYQDGNGMLALMERIEAIKPPAKEEPKEVDEPKESDKPKETDKPENSDKPKDADKPKEDSEKKKK